MTIDTKIVDTPPSDPAENDKKMRRLAKDYEVDGFNLSHEEGSVKLNLDDGEKVRWGVTAGWAEKRMNKFVEDLRGLDNKVSNLKEGVLDKLKDYRGKSGTENLILGDDADNPVKKSGEVTRRQILDTVVGEYRESNRDDPDQQLRDTLAKSLGRFGLETTLTLAELAFQKDNVGDSRIKWG